jgi:hypothetical protein
MRIVHLSSADVLVTAKNENEQRFVYMNMVHYLTSLHGKGLTLIETYSDRIANTNGRVLPFFGWTRAWDVTHV